MADYTSATEEEILEQLKKVFAETFGEGEIRLFFAPGSVNMIGEHTDYNGGHSQQEGRYPRSGAGRYRLQRGRQLGELPEGRGLGL